MGSEQKRAFLAVILSGIVLIVWQMYFAPKPPARTNVQTKQEISKKEVVVPKKEVIQKEVIKQKVDFTDYKLEKHIVKNDTSQLTLSSDLSINNAWSKSEKFNFLALTGNTEEQESLRIELIHDNGQISRVNFAIKKDLSSQDKIVGQNSQFGIALTGLIQNNGKFRLKLSSNIPYKYRVTFSSKAKELSNRQMRQYVVFGEEDTERYNVGDEEYVEGPIKWFGLDFNYHLFAIIFDNKSLVKYTVKKDGTAVIDLIHKSNEFNTNIIFTKKDYDHLASLKDSLELSVDFGIFAILAVPILRGLQFCYTIIPNYGIAIILITLLVRMLMFPLQFKSFKSMKKMQIIQPQINKIKEKYKNDTQRVQKETMELFKKNKVNPLGGCFPLLLQMPVFFAMYRVFNSAVELVGEPFFGWIQDLSIKDPYFILPILMALTMVVQQKFMPSSASPDPTQQKIMMFMPLFFGFIMKDLPSGLCLYFFASSIFGMIQQYFTYKVVK
ncbi:MAG: membrane protein insertase YidC [Bacteriovoracaceae bacterium]|nr:membrane protein insertase YidC [Bacteriovoracaceae bacterium]